MSRTPTLSDLREAAGITQAQAAANIGMTVDDIQDMEATNIDELDCLDLYYQAVEWDPDDPDDRFDDIGEDDEDEDEAWVSVFTVRSSVR